MQTPHTLRYGASAHSPTAKTTMPALVFGLVNSIIWLGVALIAWPLFVR